MEQKKATEKEEWLELQDDLDRYTFGQEAMDVEKIKQIVARMDEVLDDDTQEFRKEEVWGRICAECSEEDEDEEPEEEEREEPEAGKTGRKTGGKRIFRIMGGKKNFLYVGGAAAAIMIALFVGANIGTYATEKKNVFEVVDERKNGAEFLVSGDVENLSPDHEEQIFYSWNEIPNEYKKLTLMPYGLPQELELYQIKVNKIDTLNSCRIRYTDGHGKKSLEIDVMDYQSKELAFQDLLFEETEYIFLAEEEICDMVVKFYEDPERGYAARFTDNIQWFTFYSTLEYEALENIVYETIENNF